MNSQDYYNHYTTELNLSLTGWNDTSKKCPTHKGWGKAPIPAAMPMMGVIHGLSHTIVLDIDNEQLAIDKFASIGLDLKEIVLNAPARIKTGSGSIKPVWRLPDGVEPIYRSLYDEAGKSIFELRCATPESQKQDILPPSIHPDTGQPYTWVGGLPDDLPDCPQVIIDLMQNWPFAPPVKIPINGNGTALSWQQHEDISVDELSRVLGKIDNDDKGYDEWLKVGMACQSSCGLNGLNPFLEWSRTSQKHVEDTTVKKFGSFNYDRGNPVTFGTLKYLAGEKIETIELITKQKVETINADTLQTDNYPAVDIPFTAYKNETIEQISAYILMNPRIDINFALALSYFTLSSLVARRLFYQLNSGYIFPNLWFVLVGYSGLDVKSTALGMAKSLIKEVGMPTLGLNTPEKLEEELSLNRVANSKHYNTEFALNALKTDKLFHAQRPMIIDEVGGMFNSTRKNDFMSRLTPIMRQLYDSPLEYEGLSTIGRGKKNVENVYFPFLGATTTGEAKGFFSGGGTFESDGTQARTLLVTPERVLPFAVGEQFNIPEQLIGTLRQIFRDKLKLPQIELEPAGDLINVDYTPAPLIGTKFTQDAYKIWTDYGEAIHNIIQKGHIDGDTSLGDKHNRQFVHVLKMAMLMALTDGEVVNNQITIQSWHVARAIQDAELFRKSAYNLETKMSNMQESEIETVTATKQKDQYKILEYIRQQGGTVVVGSVNKRFQRWAKSRRERAIYFLLGREQTSGKDWKQTMSGDIEEIMIEKEMKNGRVRSYPGYKIVQS